LSYRGKQTKIQQIPLNKTSSSKSFHRIIQFSAALSSLLFLT